MSMESLRRAVSPTDSLKLRQSVNESQDKGKAGVVGLGLRVLGLGRVSELRSVLFGDSMVPNPRVRLDPLFGYNSILYKEDNLTGFNHQNQTLLN